MSNSKSRFYKIIIPLGLGSAFSILGDSTVYTVLPLHIEAAGITLAGAGVLMGINRLVRLFSNSISGYLFDFGGKRELFIASLFMGAVSTLCFAFFTGFWPLFASRVLWGVAWSGISIGGTGILLSEADPSSRGKWIGLHHVWILAGSALGAMLGGFLSDIIGYRGAMAVNGSISLASAVLAMFFLPELPHAKRTGNGIGKVSFLEIRNNYKFEFNKKLFAAAGVLGISRFVFSGFVAALLSIITREKISPWFTIIGLSTLTGIISSSKTAVSMISAPAAGFLSDKFKDRWTAVMVSLAAGSAGLLMITLLPPFIPLAGLLLCAVPGSSIMVLIRTIAGDLAGENRQGRSISFVLTAGDLGSAAGPPIAFFLYQHAGLNLIFRLMSILLFAATAAVYFIVRLEKKENNVISDI